MFILDRCRIAVSGIVLLVVAADAGAVEPPDDRGNAVDASQQASPDNFPTRCVETDESVTIMVGSRPVLRYLKRSDDPPNGIDDVYRRSGYIHPLWTPSGKVVTGDFAEDHPHQHGLFHALVNTTFQGRDVDFWNQRAQTGRVSHDRVLEVSEASTPAQFVVTQVHEDLTADGGPIRVLEETWRVTVVESALVASHVIDVESKIRCVADSPLLIQQYHYGGFAFRGNTQWFRSPSGGDNPQNPPSEFLTSEGLGRLEGNHSRPRWVELFGRIDGSLAGIAILGHPDNLRAPQPVRLHPTKPYFCFAPMVQGAYEIDPDDSIVSRYRIIVHDGALDPGVIDQEFARFSTQ